MLLLLGGFVAVPECAHKLSALLEEAGPVAACLQLQLPSGSTSNAMC